MPLDRPVPGPRCRFPGRLSGRKLAENLFQSVVLHRKIRGTFVEVAGRRDQAIQTTSPLGASMYLLAAIQA